MHMMTPEEQSHVERLAMALERSQEAIKRVNEWTPADGPLEELELAADRARAEWRAAQKAARNARS
jgi:hypothetical protein